MKILFLAKRFTSGKDAVRDNFGRQVKLAEQLQKLGHTVHFLAADYIKKQHFDSGIGAIKVFVRPLSIWNSLPFILSLRKSIKKERYDAIFAGSDPIFGIIAWFVRQKTPFIYEIQDMYEFYKSYKFPFVKMLEKKAIIKASLVVAASPKLGERYHSLNKNIISITNGVNPEKCRPIDKNKARKMFRLPKGSIVAYAGRRDRIVEKSIDLLIKSMKHVNATLLLIGDGNKSRAEKEGSSVIGFDSMEYRKLMDLLSAADVLVIVYPYEFARFGYTSFRLAEYMCFSRPIVCPDIGDYKSVLKTPNLMYRQNDIEDIAKKINAALKIKKVDYSGQLKKLTWSYLGGELDKAIRKIKH
ncbi:glycosyltransferase [Candidatus Woesearchaeota archaeon]|nr:glycosyltransferase [Candidatus Woesearchaeota archaeon]